MAIKNYIVIDGMAGVGKSYLAKRLAEEGFTPYLEPVIENPFLELFYHDRKMYAFHSQLYFLLKGYQFTEEAMNCNNAAVDRSLYGHGVFAKMLFNEGSLNNNEYEMYQEYFQLLSEVLLPPNLLVYLDADTDVILERIKKRGREFELKVPVEYWEQLNQECKRYFLDEYINSPKLIINTNDLDLVNDPAHLDEVMKQIKKHYFHDW